MEDPPYELTSRRCIGCVDLQEAQESLLKQQQALKEEPVKGLVFYYIRKQGR
jgi:hypothetical protein